MRQELINKLRGQTSSTGNSAHVLSASFLYVKAAAVYGTNLLKCFLQQELLTRQFLLELELP